MIVHNCRSLWPKWKNPVSTMTRSRKLPRKTGSRFWNGLGANKAFWKANAFGRLNCIGKICFCYLRHKEKDKRQHWYVNRRWLHWKTTAHQNATVLTGIFLPLQSSDKDTFSFNNLEAHGNRPVQEKNFSSVAFKAECGKSLRMNSTPRFSLCSTSE